MRKKLSFLVALAISLSISTTSFAAASTPVNSTTNSIQTNGDTVNLTMDDAINNIQNSNTELKLMNQKVDYLNRQYDLDHDAAISMANATGISGKTQEIITPLKDEQNVKNQKDAVDVRFNNIKFDMERQYLNILTCRDQIDNINKTITNIDEQIKKLEEQIKVGMATTDKLNPLNVQKSQLLNQIDSINNQIDTSLLTIKQYLNIDLSKNLNLSDAKKEYVKFDDTNIDDKINQAIQKDYGVNQAEASLDIVQKQKELYVRYDNDSSGGLTGVESSLISAQSGVLSASSSAKSNLWSKYYTLKSAENAVQTQILSNKKAQADYDKAKSNYDNGVIDKVSFDTTALALEKQKNLTQRAVNEYMITQEQFKYMLDGHASAQLSTQSMGVSGIDY